MAIFSPKERIPGNAVGGTQGLRDHRAHVRTTRIDHGNHQGLAAVIGQAHAVSLGVAKHVIADRPADGALADGKGLFLIEIGRCVGDGL